MTLRSQIMLLAGYNQWMNTKLYDAAGRLSKGELTANRKAFFGSLLGTLNHIVVGDTLWLKRFATHPAQYVALEHIRDMPMPASLDQVLFGELAPLREHRERLDNIINEWAASLKEADLEHTLQYTNTKGIVGCRNFGSLVLHFFNHQTHHRGQATTLLSQAGQDVGVTDLLMLIPDEARPSLIAEATASRQLG